MKSEDFQVYSIEVEESNTTKSVDFNNLREKRPQLKYPKIIKAQNKNEKDQKDNNTKGFLSSLSSEVWNTISSSFTSIKDNLMYTNFSFFQSTPIKLIKQTYINMFDKQFNPKTHLTKLIKYLNIIILMTYRSNFKPIINSINQSKYVSDCGWGCMVRSGQMMLAKAILDYKLYNIDKFYKSSEVSFSKDCFYLLIDDSILNKIKVDTLMLFLDNPVTLGDVSDIEEYFQYIKISLTAKDSSSPIPSSYEKSLTSSLEDKINPPFSIRNIFDLGRIILNKEPGEWFSDVNLIKIFCAIQLNFKIMKDLEFFNFIEGFVDERQILQKCFTTSKNNALPFESITRRGKNYYYKKNGIIFVSVRIGLQNIDKEYLNASSIEKIFNIKNNLGIIGGKPNKAFYFIGLCDEGLMYLDPHINQEAIKDKNNLRIDTNFFTYKVRNIYSIKINQLSPCFTLGFIFKNLDEYENLINDFEIYQKELGKYKIFSFQKYI